MKDSSYTPAQVVQFREEDEPILENGTCASRIMFMTDDESSVQQFLRVCQSAHTGGSCKPRI